MTPEEWRKVRTVLERALEFAPERRAAYIDSVCGADSELRRELEALLAAHEKASTGFLTGHVTGAAAFQAFGQDEPPSLAGKRIGPYRIVEEIGHGGMGAVYRAVRDDDQYRKQVAIKVVRGGWTDAFSTERFKAERQILANLDHANIARLLDGGATEDGQPYVVMEYVEGQPLDKYCDQARLSLRQRLDLYRVVCSAVAYAHQRLVIHRDLKPANILVTAHGEPKLLDFGIAKIVNPLERAEAADPLLPTVPTMRLMTVEYASPEQVRGEVITTASDVYSLGVLLYGLLTGMPPYATTSKQPLEIARSVLEDQPEKPSHAGPGKLRRQLRGDLDNIVLKALRKEPERRYASVEQLSEDIRRHQEGLPVSAQPDTFFYRGGKFLKRHKGASIAAALFVLTLIAGLAATLREAYIARAERARAEQRFQDVRQLANSLLFEVHDAIENLPGSTPARKILVSRALQYLDKLAKESGGDLGLQRELAAAYEKVGDVQGGFRTSNLGDTAGFIASYRKAIAIRESIAAADPNNVAAERELLRTRGRLSDALMGAGDMAGSLDQLKQLLPIAEKLAAADPKNISDGRNLALARLDYGWKRSGSGDWKGGLDECRAAAAMLESLASATPDDKRTLRALALAYGRIGELLSNYAHLHADSLAMHEKALGVERALLERDPQNTDLRRIQAWDTLRAGEEIRVQGDVSAALGKFEAALDSFRALSTADPANAQFHFDVAAGLSRIGAVDLETGSFQAAAQNFTSSLAEVERFSKSGATDTDAAELVALDEFHLGKAYQGLAGKHAENWRLARSWYERSIPALDEAAKRGALEGDETEALGEARRGITVCDQQLGRLATSGLAK